MRPLTVDDLLPLQEYANRRREFFEARHRYVDRYRRVRVGPRLRLVFENRQTLWFRVQEILRVARLSRPEHVQRELDLYNRLLPRADGLQAALLIDISDETHLTQELNFWAELRGENLCLILGSRKYPAHLVTCRPEDYSIGAAHWVRFTLDGAGRESLVEPRQPAYVEVVYRDYAHQSPLFSEEIRQSLWEDLEPTD